MDKKVMKNLDKDVEKLKSKLISFITKYEFTGISMIKEEDKYNLRCHIFFENPPQNSQQNSTQELSLDPSLLTGGQTTPLTLYFKQKATDIKEE